MSKSRYLCATSIALALTAYAGGAYAQQGQAKPAEPNDVEEVVVTGSFIAGTPEDSSIPVEAVTLEELRNQGSPSNVDLVKTMSESGSVAGEANRSNLFAVGAATINLRGVGAARTVVVLNGRRLPDQYSFSVGRFNNIAIVPNAAIGRVETLKDGGATTYGADAVGGVVNYITRKNLDGLETNANYRFIDGSQGDYDADVSWGKVGDKWNVFAVVGYQHRSELDTKDRSFTDQEYLTNPAAWSSYGNPGSYQFQRAGQTTVITPSAVATTGNRLALDANGNAIQMSASGLVRDPSCTQLGGFAGWSATPSPICYFQTNLLSNLVEKQNTWQGYGEFNYEFDSGIKFHLEGMLYDLDVPQIPLDTFVSVPLVFPIQAGSATGASQALLTGTSAYAVAGSNPAVANLLSRIRNSDGTLAFGDPTVAGTQANQIVNGGRVGLPTAAWRPWGFGPNPAPETDLQHNTNKIYRVSAEFSGDLPEFLGMNLKWSVAGTYNLSLYNIKFQDMSVDRLQAALNGFGGPNCTGTVAGANGCQYFNPFPSAYGGTINGIPNPVAVTTGNFAGYTAGQGLQNNPDLVRWMYYPVELKRRGEYAIYDFLISGETPLKLWAQDPVAIAVGAQYRYFREELDLSDLAERAKNPCATPGVTTCVTRSGPGVFSRGSGVTGFTNDQDRRYPRVATFFEVQAPIFDTLVTNVSGRYEKFYSDISDVNLDVFVPQGSVKWQALDWLAFRGTVSKSFSLPSDPPANNGPIAAGNVAAPADFGATAVLFTSQNYPNLGIQPEKGWNYNVGAIVQQGGFRANLDYYNIEINGLVRAQTTAQIVTALVQPGQLGSTALINCSSPLLTESQELLGGKPFVQLNGPCVNGTSRLNSAAGGGGLAGGTINFFGPQAGLPAYVNGGKLKTSGIDLSASYRFDEVAMIGGQLTINGDWTHILTYEQTAFVVGGVEVAKGYKGVGQLNETTGRTVAHIAEDRGSFGFNYRRGRHSFTWTTRFVSSMINDDTNDFAEQQQYNGNIGNAQGVVPTGAACVDTNPTTPPLPTGAGTGQFGGLSGTSTGFCAGQNYAITNYKKLPWSWNTDISYNLNVGWDTTFTFTVQNLFDEDPDFSRDVVGYDAGTNSPLGRTVRFGVRKRW